MILRGVQRSSNLDSDLGKLVELRGFEPLTPSMRTRCATGLRYSPKTGASVANSGDAPLAAAILPSEVRQRYRLRIQAAGATPTSRARASAAAQTPLRVTTNPPRC